MVPKVDLAYANMTLPMLQRKSSMSIESWLMHLGVWNKSVHIETTPEECEL